MSFFDSLRARARRRPTSTNEPSAAERRVQHAIDLVDAAISAQLTVIMHAQPFQTLEGAWRGLHYIVTNTETNPALKIRVLNIQKGEIQTDLAAGETVEEAQLYKLIFDREFGTAGGQPYGVLIGDYEFTQSPADVASLTKLSDIAAAACCPFISSAAADFFGMESFAELTRPVDLIPRFEDEAYAGWRSFRRSENSRFVTLCLPKTLARLPYGERTNPSSEFHFEELPLTDSGRSNRSDEDNYCWMNTAYVEGAVITRAFAEHGWCIHIQGYEGGGRIENLPLPTFMNEQYEVELMPLTESPITTRRELELSKLGFLPLCRLENTNYVAFFRDGTTHQPNKYDDLALSSTAATAARLSCSLAISRVVHYMRVIYRDKFSLGSFMEVEDYEQGFNEWLARYIGDPAIVSDATNQRLPLREAWVDVAEVEGYPGSVDVQLHMRPWLNMGEPVFPVVWSFRLQR